MRLVDLLLREHVSRAALYSPGCARHASILAVPEIGLAQVGDPQQAVTAAHAVIAAQHIQSPDTSEHGRACSS